MKNRPMTFLQRIEQIPRKLGAILIPDLIRSSSGRGAIKLPLVGYCQTDSYSCGVAAGWSALKFLVPNASLKKFDRDCAPDRDDGTPSRRLVAALRKNGCSVSMKRLGFGMISKALREGKPVLTAIHLREEIYHWVAIFGVAPGRVFLTGRRLPGFSGHSVPWRELRRRNGPWLSLIVSRCH